MTLKNKISNLYVNKNYSSPFVVHPILKIKPIEDREDSLDKTEQGHGLAFETYIKAAYPNSSNQKRKNTSIYDIEKKFDKVENLSTNIKTKKNSRKVIDLADARRAFSNNEDFRLLVLEYEQKGIYKVPSKLYEFFITKEEWSAFKGNIPLEIIESFHNDLTQFIVGKHKEARIYAKARKKEITHTYSSAFILNPKIDSKDQRILQISIKLANLLNSIKKQNIILSADNTSMSRGICISKITSKARNDKLNKKNNYLKIPTFYDNHIVNF